MALGKRLRDLLHDRNMTVKEFAHLIDVPPTTLYSFITRDGDTGKLELINKISNGLNMSINEFMQSDYEFKDIPQDPIVNADVTKKYFKNKSTPALAAHFDGDEYTEAELEEIKKFAEFVKSKREEK